MATLGGRITVAERKLILTRQRTKEERLLTSDEEWRMALKDHFGVVL
jgi:hypothetical protein